MWWIMEKREENRELPAEQGEQKQVLSEECVQVFMERKGLLP